jgi:predicted SnoaL-like aldol condensation-catalyzing enzyme
MQMMMKLVTTSVVGLMLTAHPSSAQSNMNAKEQANVKFVLDWWREVIQARHVDMAPKYQAEDYIQHNINIQTGRAGFQKVFGSRGEPLPIAAELNPKPAIAFGKGDYVVVIWEREGKDPADPGKSYKYNTYDLLRLQNGKVQEHWDYALKTPKIPYGGAPDGVDYSKVTFTLSPQEQKNLEIATVEFKDILQYGHTELAEKVMAPTYIQHNPNVPTGRAAFVEFFSRIRKPEPIQAEWKDKPTMTIVSGSYVFMMFKQTLKDPDDPAKTYPAFWFDMVRVDNGMVQEHWDAAVKNAPPPSK